MYLKRIELSGFKSFATKTVLDFLPSCSLAKNGKKCGITAIVGPNGSGKSNIADAVRWTMGEQSLKNIRGKKSEDVIFAGSGKKSQLGSAKVSLFLDNSDKRIPIEFEEVIITRKVYRSGEGEYYVNKSRVRLIDIIDLLAKAGVGQRSYCIINQGMADAVLNATPVERRIILEEAAGVKPYQLKKERSIRKLESTRQNLARVADLVKEISPHLRVLKRQSEKAKKGKDVVRELRQKQEEFFGFLWKKTKTEKESIHEEKEEAGREEIKIQRKIDELEAKIQKEGKTSIDFENKRDILERERQEIFEKINQVEKELAIIGAKIEIEKEKSKNFLLISEIPVDFPYVRGKIGKIQARYKNLGEEIERVKNLEDIIRFKQNFLAVGEELQSLYREVSEGKKKEEKKKEMENVVDLRVTGELEERKREFAGSLARLKSEADASKKKMEELISHDRESRRHYFELEGELRKKRHEVSMIREKINEIRIRLAKVEVREEDLKEKIKQDLGVHEPDELLSKGAVPETLDAPKYERDIGRLKTLSEQIGAIDPLIIEEYEETQKRYDFLTGQSKDLEKAIGSLAEVIKEMDERIKGSFEETFKKVDSEFSKYFKIIFGGGSAELVKTKIEMRRNIKDISGEKADEADSAENMDEEAAEEEEGPKEVGIEIKVCPPGKRISGLNILSGGERALTSQALLFAIIANSPPPFAILDEIEAALDEANSRRFGRILQEFSHETQFVLITHNRETMRQASVLYGVTMSTDGVSRVLSVKLDQVGEEGEIR
ncbi:MAG: hypothetical protein COW51_03705 [Candidatus Moranbacteria bacterium CG17_big_fil_post_rev_8_21_14_2_50_44_12]|nr:MAG: hypothetical protein COW51_03705 [Candidatus Moranbacteria bacterium CG17_big_fil_post_rev_8_21_14_2_50_44_12]